MGNATMKELDEALEVAHLPALLCAMVHLTGDASWLKSDWRPTYTPLMPGDTGIPGEEQANIRAAARPVLEPWLAGDKALPPPPSADVVHKMMHFTTGAEI